MASYAMVIDLQRCLGCYACVVACEQTHALPPGTRWGRVLKREVGHYPNERVYYLPVQCQQCENPPCVDVCPTGATYQDERGVVQVDQDKCMGCRYCEAACPYGARSLVKSLEGYWPESGLTEFEQSGYGSYTRGVVSKCDFCEDRVAHGLEPQCVLNCPGLARTFGDRDDATSEVSRKLVERTPARLLENLGTQPKVFYLL